MNAVLVVIDPHHVVWEAFAVMNTSLVKGVPFNTPPLIMSDSSYLYNNVFGFGEATYYVYGEMLGPSLNDIERWKTAGATN